MGYTITAKLSDRKALENDTDFFHHIALKFFKVINWYSFKPQDQKNGKYVHFFLPLISLISIQLSKYSVFNKVEKSERFKSRWTNFEGQSLTLNGSLTE